MGRYFLDIQYEEIILPDGRGIGCISTACSKALVYEPASLPALCARTDRTARCVSKALEAILPLNVFIANPAQT